MTNTGVRDVCIFVVLACIFIVSLITADNVHKMAGGGLFGPGAITSISSTANGIEDSVLSKKLFDKSDVIVGWEKFQRFDHVPDEVMRVSNGSCTFAVKTIVVFRSLSGAHIYAHARAPGPDSVAWCGPTIPGEKIEMHGSPTDWSEADADYDIDYTGHTL